MPYDIYLFSDLTLPEDIILYYLGEGVEIFWRGLKVKLAARNFELQTPSGKVNVLKVRKKG